MRGLQETVFELLQYMFENLSLTGVEGATAMYTKASEFPMVYISPFYMKYTVCVLVFV